MQVTGGSDVVALVGHPVSHSVSPQVHNAAFAAVGIDAVYVACDVEPLWIADALRAVTALGLRGANITVPHKRAAFASFTARTTDAEVSGAANCLYWDSDRLTADNTDIEGLGTVLRDDIRLRPGDAVTLFGTGGAARAAAVALGRLGAAVAVLGRRPEAVSEIQRLVDMAGGTIGHADPRVVINATPLGLRGERLPADLLHVGRDQVALDLVYGPEDTPFLAAARSAGATALDGRGMLVGQAAAAFERWFSTPAPIDVMRSAAAAALRGPAKG